ncbi:BING4CT-domain-containing protein [Flagelloscypha sp. PMI_526]|nr:BING4CT-domain-containing protein [Flagelloscypha sp. PMI_526]
MDSLIAKAQALEPALKKRKLNHYKKKNSDPAHDKTLQPSATEASGKTYDHLSNKKLKTQLSRQSAHNARAKSLVEDAELLLTGDAGKMERTWRVTQSEVAEGAGLEASNFRRQWKLDGGPVCHVATFDWRTGQMHAELQLQETCRDITFLHDQSHFAVAQKKYAFIYDKNGSGYLKYIDTSTGTQVASHAPGSLGPTISMTQNGIVGLWTPNFFLSHLGPVTGVAVDPSKGGLHMATSGRDGMVKVWDLRNLGKNAIRSWRDRHASSSSGTLLEFSQKGHLAVVSGGTINVYTSPSLTTPFPNVTTPPPLYMTHPIPQRPLTGVTFCPFQDILTVGHGAGLSSILVPGSGEPNFDSTEADPFENAQARREREVKGLLDKIPASMISLDADHEIDTFGLNKPKSRKEETPFARLKREERLRISGKADVTEEDGVNDEREDERGGGVAMLTKGEKIKNKMRGKGKSMKRFLRKQKKNVIDPKSVAIRAKLEKQKEEKRKAEAMKKGIPLPQAKKGGALDIFRTGNR